MLKKLLSKQLSKLAMYIIKINTKDLKVCIISNDCWGGQFYRCTNRPYNTPFVGLMMMAPCYIKFLRNPHFYLIQSLEFSKKTMYKDLEEFWYQKGEYPIGFLHDIELHFLHYDSEREALLKWNRRKDRIDWNNIYIKFAMDKDFADEKLLKEFDTLSYKNKISFSKYDYRYDSNFKLTNYVENGSQLFIKCFKDFDLLKWLKDGTVRSPNITQKILNLYISRFLKIS